jgi:hypothetical protein
MSIVERMRPWLPSHGVWTSEASNTGKLLGKEALQTEFYFFFSAPISARQLVDDTDPSDSPVGILDGHFEIQSLLFGGDPGPDPVPCFGLLGIGGVLVEGLRGLASGFEIPSDLYIAKPVGLIPDHVLVSALIHAVPIPVVPRHSDLQTNDLLPQKGKRMFLFEKTMSSFLFDMP